MADNYKDFDAAVEAEDILKFTMMGKDYELSSQLPTEVILTQMRHMDETV